jgi:hypothetical protein
VKKVHVLNLSIGGPDFMDQPFIDKVQIFVAVARATERSIRSLVGMGYHVEQYYSRISHWQRWSLVWVSDRDATQYVSSIDERRSLVL